MTYEEAMERYGSDRPDLRFDMAFQDLTDILRETQYGIFRQVISQGGSIKGFCVKGKAALLSKNVLQNEYAMKIAPSFGARGMTWMKGVNGGLESNIVQFFSHSEQSRLKGRFNVSNEDVLIMIADPSRDKVNKVLCSLRLHLAERLGMIPQDQYRPLWVTDFPLFELKDGKLASQHHPFTMPDRTDFDPMNKEEMVTLKSRAYDLVMNGEELGGGSIRIHQMEIQRKIFRALELTEDEIEAKFGFFLRALEFGAPPHGGLALGMDRVVAMILKAPSIREVIAFPKNRSAYCPLSQAPSSVDDSQLEELGLLKPALASRVSNSKKGEGTEERLPRPSERVDLNQVRHIAKLARLRMTEEEALSYQNDLNDILSYVETLGELDTGAVEPMHHVLEIKNVWREDRQGKSEKHESILSNAPSRDGDYYKVPRIIDG
jgi:aspartyl-tRNA synthetase